jgi:spermidine synthase
MSERFPGIFLLAAVFVIAVCGLVYELIAASLSSYLLGGSITQFSIVIGVFLTAMGLGSYLTRFVNENLIDVFIAVQLGIGVSGGLSAAILMITFASVSHVPACPCGGADCLRNSGRDGSSAANQDSAESGSAEAHCFQCIGS